jgi:peptide/nickel transport system permease protein
LNAGQDDCGKGVTSATYRTSDRLDPPETRSGVIAQTRYLLKRARLSFRRNPLGWLGLFLLIIILMGAVFAPLIATQDPLQLNVNERLQPPSAQHLFGTDASGRDIYSRVLYGARISLRVVVIVIVIALSIGGSIGVLAGYFGGLIDESLMRITDVFLAFPSLVLAMAVNAALGPGITSAVLAVGLTWWPGYARMIRGQVLCVKNTLYVEASRSLGAGNIRILFRHILPNCIGPTIVQISLDAGYIVLTFAGLSFIGLGVQPPTPEWGALVSEGSSHLLTQWWWATFPGLAICLLVVGFNLVGDYLRDLLDPRFQGIVK